MPAKRSWSSENLTIVITDMLEKAASESEFRDRLRDPELAKAEVLERIDKPDDWDQRHFLFDEFIEREPEILRTPVPYRIDLARKLVVIDIARLAPGLNAILVCRNSTTRGAAVWQ